MTYLRRSLVLAGISHLAGLVAWLGDMRTERARTSLGHMKRIHMLSVLSLLSLAACASTGPEAPSELDSNEQGLTLPAGGLGLPLPDVKVLSPGGVRGILQCHGAPLVNAAVTIGKVTAVTNETGAYVVNVNASGNVPVRVGYDVGVTSDGVTSRLRVVDELQNGRNESFSRTGTSTIVGRSLAYDLGTVNLTSLDCELFRIGRLALVDYHNVRRASPPTGMLQIKRMSDVHFGTPYSYYTMINIRTNWLDDTSVGLREHTIFHEFGHAIRHAADGPEDHWNWDNFRWAYARNHNGTELFNTQYAFNEGWAGFWEESRFPARSIAAPTATERHNMHFNEDMIHTQLLRDLQLPGNSRRIMVEVLEANPGTIHSLNDYERRLFARLGLAAPAAAPSCPLGWNDDGATCRTGGEVIAKSSYGRGVGTPQDGCSGGKVNDGGLCYTPCPADHDGFATRCIQDCAPGYSDHGLTCFREIFDWYWKGGFDRGVGELPSGCTGGKVLNDGLCYDPCRTGWSGGGPVCYSPCPEGWDDDGATCRRPLWIMTKY